ncbi:hypothetical protein COX59_02370 [Candidatus Beckwithbacteria bacterium CG_4_10_14_0_2_um_filter_47_25]|uniref:Uncharacterized protein n=1 Tax=Candidatus Beckwithbacteria bacterium CG_4_10_14_0_2_um_filter_47_25 TaxID=1974493 RepID=A0A2M7W788_9BACT|nr:MAG: hypothetical protein COX59_02370 [Candidatus Beckwithbacteria bacterium CG_4_10_14_0_2_um_filter_47_25]
MNMTMKMSKRLPLVFLILVVGVLGLGLVRSKYQSFKTQQADDQKLCSLTARPTDEREKAVAAIRDFLEMPTAEVEYECNNAFYSEEEDRLITAKGETYTAGMMYFVVDPATNYVQKDYDYSSNYSQEEVEQIAKGFIAKHPSAIGNIDLQ